MHETSVPGLVNLRRGFLPRRRRLGPRNSTPDSTPDSAPVERERDRFVDGVEICALESELRGEDRLRHRRLGNTGLSLSSCSVSASPTDPTWSVATSGDLLRKALAPTSFSPHESSSCSATGPLISASVPGSSVSCLSCVWRLCDCSSGGDSLLRLAGLFGPPYDRDVSSGACPSAFCVGAEGRSGGVAVGARPRADAFSRKCSSASQSLISPKRLASSALSALKAF